MESLEHAGLMRRLLEHTEGGASLPDGRAEGASDEAWRTLLARLKVEWDAAWPWADGRLPSGVADLTDAAFASCHVRGAPSAFITVYPSWGTESIYFDFSSAEMRSQSEVDALSGFVRELGRIVQGPVKLSHEGDQDEVFAVYDPERDAFRWTD